MIASRPCVVGGWMEPIDTSNLFYQLQVHQKRQSAHPLYRIEDRRCFYVTEISENLCDVMISL